MHICYKITQMSLNWSEVVLGKQWLSSFFHKFIESQARFSLKYNEIRHGAGLLDGRSFGKNDRS